MATRLRFLWAKLANPRCEAFTGCKRPAVAGVKIYGWPRHICAWHLEPLTEDRPLAFLGRFYMEPS